MWKKGVKHGSAVEYLLPKVLHKLRIADATIFK